MTDLPTPPTQPPAFTPPMPTGPLRTGLAVTTLVLGILGLLSCFPAGLAAIVTGIIALSRISSEPHRYGGRGMAIGGLVCGGASLLLIPVFALMISILLPSLSRARELSKRLVCQANMQSIGTTMMIYANDYPGQGCPPVLTFVTSGDITQQQTVCPSSQLGTSNYVFLPLPDSAGGDTVWAYEPKSNHGGEGGNVLFADGHASFFHSNEYDRLITDALNRGGP